MSYQIANNNGFNGSFSTASPAFSAEYPSPSVLSGFDGSFTFGPSTLALDGVGNTDLVIKGLDDSSNHRNSASLVIPEPSTLALFAIGMLAIGWLARRRRAGA